MVRGVRGSGAKGNRYNPKTKSLGTNKEQIETKKSNANNKLNENKNEKGVDAYDTNGIKYEIKTRRVYESGRRKGKSRRLNNLVGKTSTFLVVVALDKSFRCAGMWLIPMKNVHNPKSAHLQIVNSTPGTKTIVKSKIEWLN